MRPHDLLRLADGARLRCEGHAPAWTRASLTQAPWVVVRRASPAPDNLVPVGVRGRARAQRLAASVGSDAVLARVAPEDLTAARGWRRVPRARWVDALRVLDAVDELFAVLGLAWGPTGSVGFELATGVATARAASDLDVVVRAPEPLPIGDARELAAELSRLPVRVDAQLDAPAGAVSLAEYARGDRVLLRTLEGPRLVHDPWRDATVGARTA